MVVVSVTYVRDIPLLCEIDGDMHGSMRPLAGTRQMGDQWAMGVATGCETDARWMRDGCEMDVRWMGASIGRAMGAG